MRVAKSSHLLVCLVLLYVSVHTESQELKYALFTAGPLGGFDSSGAVPAIELAEEIVNSDNSVLPGYNLTHTRVLDTMCDRTISFNEYFNTIPPPNPTVLGLLGCGCSVASTPVAEVIHHRSLSQVAYSSASIELSDRRRFPNFFRTYPSDADFTPAIVTLIQYYGWRRIAFITQEEGLFTGTFDMLRGPLRDLDIAVVNRMVPSRIPIGSLDNPEIDFFFEDDDHRVFFINTYSDTARQIICEAYKKGFTYPRYVWLTYGWYQNRWWTEEVNPQEANCTDDQLAGFLHRALALQIFPVANDSDAMTDTGLTPNQFDTLYRMRLNTPEARQNNYTFTFVATVAYDALWTFALALDETVRMIESRSREEILDMTQCAGSDDVTGRQWELVPLESFTYSNELMGCVVRWNLERTDFVGVSGRVVFNRVGSRMQSQVQIYQYRVRQNNRVTRVSFAYTQNFNVSAAEFIYKDNHSNDTVYPPSEGGIPSDGTPIQQVNTFHLALVVIYYALAAAGVVFCTVCLVFNFTQRKKKVVRLTSPNLNYFIIIGCFIIYTSIYFRIMPSTDFTVNAARCSIDALLITIGYCFAFGTILAKMGRIYHIFHNPTTSKKTLKDWHLILMVLAITGFGTLLAVLQVSVDQLRPTPYLDTDQEYGVDSRNEFGVRINHTAYACFSTSNTVQSAWLILVTAYLALLQLIGIILAIQTRKVKIKVLNDSKYIAVLIYISSLVLLVVTVVQFTIGNYINVVESIYSGGLLVAATLFLLLLFIPKMVSLYKDPEGEFVFDKSNGTASMVETGLAGLTSSSKKDRSLTQLESRVAELENLLKEYQNGGRISSSNHLSPTSNGNDSRRGSNHLSPTSNGNDSRRGSGHPLIEENGVCDKVNDEEKSVNQEDEPLPVKPEQDVTNAKTDNEEESTDM